MGLKYRCTICSGVSILGGEKMNLVEKAEEIAKYMRECQRQIHKKGHEIAQEYNLTLDQYHLLLYLNFLDNPPTIGEIAEKCEKAQNTISEKVSRLEEKFLVARKSDPLDRRICRVEVTDKGKELISTIKKERSDKTVLIAIKNMDEKEVDNLIINLEKLYKNLKEEG